MTVEEWKEEKMAEVEGTVFISCVIQEVPHHPGTSRYQVYNEEGTYDRLYDIATDERGEIINIK